MKWLVRFPTPVVYQPEHWMARREITELPVHAPDARSAEIHAIRTCGGDVSGLTVEPFTGVFGSPPIIEPPQDVPVTILVGE